MLNGLQTLHTCQLLHLAILAGGNYQSSDAFLKFT